MAIVNVEGTGILNGRGISRKIFGALEEENINVILIAQASSEQSISFCCNMVDCEVARSILSEVFDREVSDERATSERRASEASQLNT